MVKFWQAWMTVGMDAMQRTAMLFAPGAGLPEWMSGLRDEMEKAVRAALEAARIPSIQDLQRFVDGLATLCSQVEAMRTGLAALESLVKGQQAMWQTLENSIQQIARVQQEMQRAMATWSSQWEDRLAGVTRGLEEWRQRWEEMLRQGMAMSQASHKDIEDLTKSLWDLSQKVMGGQR
jgi:DNA repair exonuclease SbcCD ATPase subunit